VRDRRIRPQRSIGVSRTGCAPTESARTPFSANTQRPPTRRYIRALSPSPLRGEGWGIATFTVMRGGHSRQNNLPPPGTYPSRDRRTQLQRSVGQSRTGFAPTGFRSHRSVACRALGALPQTRTAGLCAANDSMSLPLYLPGESRGEGMDARDKTDRLDCRSAPSARPQSFNRTASQAFRAPGALLQKTAARHSIQNIQRPRTHNATHLLPLLSGERIGALPPLRW